MVMRLFSVVMLSLLFVGAGCAKVPAELMLPTVPPNDAMMRQEDTAMEPKDDAMVDESKDGATVKQEDAAKGSSDEPMMVAKKPYYIAYTAEGVTKALAEGRPVMLYFYASWCPICRAEDPKIKQWVEGSSTAIAGFRVDYTTEKALNEKYRVPYQHTTVFLDAKGIEVGRFSGPMTQVDFEAAFDKASK